jgi:superfamily II DNA or RNA helicase
MLNIIVDNRLRFDADAVAPSVVQSIRNAFTHRNPAYHKKRAMGFYPGKESEYIHTYEEDEEGWFSVPRGGTQTLRKVFGEAGIRYRFTDRSYEGDPIEVPTHKLRLYPYQAEAVEACYERRNCLLRSPTGSGKTTVGINLITRVARPTIIIVWSSALAKQWIDRLVNELGLPPKSIGRVMGGKVDVQPITVAMQQTLHSRTPASLGIDRYFGLLIADEVQRFAATTFREVTEPFHAKWRIGISADETRNDGKEFLIYDVFGRVGYEIDQAPLVDSGYIHDVEVRVIPTNFRADWYATNKDFTALTDAMALDKKRNELAMQALDRAFADGSSAMVFSHRVRHCQVLDALCAEHGIKSGLMLGGVEWATTFDATGKGLREGTVQVGIGTIQAIGQGIDVPAVDRGVIVTPITGNRQQFGQVRGRICRTTKGKHSAIIYYLWDRHVYGLFALRNLAKWSNTVTVLDDSGRLIEASEYIKLHQQRRRHNGTQTNAARD